MFVPSRFCVWVLIWASVLVAALAWTAKACAATKAPRSTNSNAPYWRVSETSNFRIYSYNTQPLDQKVANECEAIREQVAVAWFGAGVVQTWEPKCDLVLHGNLAGYRSAVGKLANCTAASCLIETVAGKTVRRRIDVRGDCPRWIEHLPHELTHMLSDQRVISDQLPPWIDEGMALVADPVAKRDAHERDLRTAIRAGRQFRMADLLRLRSYPSEQRLGTFYGQSLSVVEFLLDRGGREKFVAFAKQATKNGYDVALREMYGIHGVQELDRQWFASVQGAQYRQTAFEPELDTLEGCEPVAHKPASAERESVRGKRKSPARAPASDLIFKTKGGFFHAGQ